MTDASPQVGDRFRVACHDTRVALVTAVVTAERITRMSDRSMERYRVTTTRPGVPEGECLTLEFVVDQDGREVVFDPTADAWVHATPDAAR